ncbi:hypothetical protein ACR9YC_07080 [Parasphingorhabdus sp. DH2-15]|uniref:hypothetical protein n=1 Tax=Parasphingorhabdus sp. DH2-15 TaxID=3444112 RepID=UPI003F687DDB
MNRRFSLLSGVAGLAVLFFAVPASAQSPEMVLNTVRANACPAIGEAPTISALDDTNTRNRLIAGNGKLISELGAKIGTARRSVQQLIERQQRSGIDSRKQISLTQGQISAAQNRLTVALGFWVLARWYDYRILPDTIVAGRPHPLTDIAKQLAVLDTIGSQAGDPRVTQMVELYRQCATEAAIEYLDIAQSLQLAQRSQSVAAVDSLSRMLLPTLGSAAEARLRRHPVFRELSARRLAVRSPPRSQPVQTPQRSAAADRCTLAKTRAQRSLPMVRQFLNALQKRQLRGTRFLAANAELTGGGRSIRGRDKIIAQFSSFGGSGSIAAPTVSGCGQITARYSGRRSGTIQLRVSNNKIQSITIT